MNNRVNLTLDIMKASIKNPLITVRQGEGNFETLRATVNSNGEPLDLQGWTIMFMGTTAGKHKIVDGDVTIVDASKGIFEYTPSKAWGMDVGGFKIAYFKFVSGDGSTSSANFQVEVIEAVDLTQEEAQNYISIVDTTIAEAREHLESSLADVSSSVAATYVAADSLAVNVSSVASSAVSQVSSAASNASSVASSAVNMVSTVASSTINKVNGVAAQVNGLSIGGRNLLLDSRLLPFKVNPNGGAKVEVVQYDSKTNMWHITSPKSGNGGVGIYFWPDNDVSDTVMNGTRWAFSADIKGVGVYAQFGVTSSTSVNNPSGNVDVEWTRVYSTGTATTKGALVLYFNARETALDVYIKLPKLERGNVPTDWTPAPEDAPSNDAQLVHKTGTETIAGDKAFTGNTTLSTTTMLAGNYGLRVTASGIQKMTDGKTWVSANI